MRVINLLPWRERQFKQRRQRFVLMSLIITMTAAVWLAADVRQAGHQRLQHQRSVQALSSTLSDLQAAHSVVQHAAAERLAESQRLLQMQQQWRQQVEWQQLIAEWLLLAADAHIAQITWHEGGLMLRGVSAELEPLRHLVQQAPLWQLQDIQLDASNHFQFTLLHAGSSAESRLEPVPGEV